jgi:hypothetical protein
MYEPTQNEVKRKMIETVACDTDQSHLRDSRAQEKVRATSKSIRWFLSHHRCAIAGAASRCSPSRLRAASFAKLFHDL